MSVALVGRVSRVPIMLLVFLFLIVLSNNVEATFGCEIRSASTCLANQTLLVRLNSSEPQVPNNSHAQLANVSVDLYQYSICCWTDAFRTLVNECSASATRILGLEQTNNSHVQAGTNNSYIFSACFNVTSGNISCEYPNDACSGGYDAVASMSSSEPNDNNLTNAHLSEFPEYRRKICCRIGAQNPPIVAYADLSPINASTRNDLLCDNGTVSDADGDDVTLHYNWIRNNVSLTLLNMPMDNDNGVTHDFSGYGNDGTVINATFLPTGGQIGGSFDFDGDDEIQLTSTINLTEDTPWSISYWFYDAMEDFVIRSALGEDNGETNSSIIHRTPTGDTLILFIAHNNSNVIVNTGENLSRSWNHLVITNSGADSNNLVFYINGSALPIQSLSATNIKINNIGKAYSGSVSQWQGRLDEIMIFNHTLTAEEALALYNNNNRYLNGTELSRNDTWNCSITPIDSTGLNGSTVFSNQTLIFGSPPTVPILVYPLDGNASVFERTIPFNWTSDERDGDNTTYQFNLSVTAGACSEETEQTGISDSNFTYGELCVDQLYWWNITACDDQDGCSNTSLTFNFTIASILSVVLNDNNVDFGSLVLNQMNYTDDYVVDPFLLENNGNVLANITLDGNTSPFTSVGLDDPAYQFRVEDNETGAINATGSQTTYTPVPSNFVHAIKQLNYSDDGDVAAIHINVTVPAAEPGGDKEGNITIQAVAS